MKIRMFIEDDDDRKKTRKTKKKSDVVPTTFAGNNAPVNAARYLEEKYHIGRAEIEKKVN